jgi:protein N-lysine methyltransferase METTL21A
MLPLMEENIDRNRWASAISNVKAAVLDWGSPLPDYIPHGPTIILAADCVYFEPSFPLLLCTMQQLLGPGSVCYFCFKKRRRADFRFMKQAKKIFHVIEIRDYPGWEAYAKQNLFLYLIRSRSAPEN